jgi:hypothetical protein
MPTSSATAPGVIPRMWDGHHTDELRRIADAADNLHIRP